MKFVLPVGLLLVGCSGGCSPGSLASSRDRADVVDPDAPVIDPGLANSKTCQAVNPGRAPLRRLSNAEYRNTVTDLLGAADEVKMTTLGFVAEIESLGFRNNADFLQVSNLVADQFMGAADRLASLAAADASFVKCANPDDATDCGSEFIKDFGLRAFRRPLTETEIAAYEKLFQDALAAYDFQTGIEWVTYTMLQSPHFLFRVEFGGDPVKNGYARPTNYEMASRLSYLLWQSMPDEKLFQAAADGKLSASADVLAQAKRMLSDPKAERTLEFFRQWLDADALDSLKRDENVFANLPANLKELFAEEMQAFTRHLVFESEGTFDGLIAAPYTFVNADLAKHYELEGDFGSEFVRVDRRGSSGFLTQGGFLAAHDKPTRTSIVLRGVKLRTDVMCQLVPAPPDDVELDLEGLGEGLSQKERLALHRKEPSCAGCHELIDPLGVTFEGFDAVGRQRSVDEDGKDIDTASEITQSIDLDGPIDDPVDLGKAFATSEQIRQCYVAQNFRFFFGRDYTAADLCSRAKVTKAFQDSNYNMRDMLLALTQTDAFLYRPASSQ